MKNAFALLDDLGRRHTEWRPWLSVIDVALRECEDAAWDEAVPARARDASLGIPLLDGASIDIDGARLRKYAECLFGTATRCGTAKMQTVRLLGGAMHDVALFTASTLQDANAMAAIARTAGAEPDAVQAVASLIASPFLHACRRAWPSVECWTDGYCFVCGSWPAFAEVRGIERTRYLRCGRCGAAWQASVLCCTYCRSTDHARLRSLVVEGASPHSIDACQECHGYVKTFTMLRGHPPATVMLHDMATVDLDVAAVTRGYSRREGSAVAMTITATATRSRRLFADKASALYRVAGGGNVRLK